MKILVITDLYPIKNCEKFTPKTIKNFVDGWEELGHEVRVIKPNFIFNSFLRRKPFYKSDIYGNVENINYFLPFIGNIKNKIKTEFTPDIVIAHMPSGVIFANKLKLPFVAGVHVSDLEVLTNPIYSIYFKPELEKAYKNATKIACRSNVLKQKFLKLYPEYENKTFVCYSGIDFEPIKRSWQPSNKIKVLTCANLIKRKNVDLVIKECDSLDVVLRIIGDGKELKNLKKLSSKPVFLGYLPHAKVLEEMKKADIFALPSVNETFGMVYLEAMASGCITICQKNDGISGIIKDKENGYFWEDGIIEKIINSKNQNKILENCFNTIQNYTSNTACLNYLKKALAQKVD